MCLYENVNAPVKQMVCNVLAVRSERNNAPSKSGTKDVHAASGSKPSRARSSYWTLKSWEMGLILPFQVYRRHVVERSLGGGILGPGKISRRKSLISRPRSLHSFHCFG